MNRAIAAAKLGLLAILAVILIPIQAALVAVAPSRAGWLPVLFHRTFLALFNVRVREKGRPEAGAACLVLSNHVSWLDIPVIGSLRPLSFVAKSEIAGWPLVGHLAKLQRSVFIERARKAATAEVNAEVARRLKQGQAIVLFPEGTTGDGNRLLAFRSSLIGAARAALSDPAVDTIMLQPLAIAYVRRNGLPVTRRERPEIAWYGDMDLAPHLMAFLHDGPLDVEIRWGEPIPFDAGSDRKHATVLAERAVKLEVHRAMGFPVDP
jgi:1-acyl-sn-glycerol-3-phosphate acyltransferase